MSFVDDNDRFEAWLRQHCRVVEDDLKRKHKKMSRDVFSFYSEVPGPVPLRTTGF